MNIVESVRAWFGHEEDTGDHEKSTATLKLKLEGGGEVEIELRYADPKDAIQAIRGISQDKYLFRLAVGLGAIDGYEFADDGDDD